MVDLLSIEVFRDQSEHVGDWLHKSEERTELLKLPGESPPGQHPGDADDGGVDDVHQELRDRLLPPGDPAEAGGLHEGPGELEDDLPRGVDGLPEKPRLLLQGAVAPLDDLAQGHGLAHLPLPAGVDGVVQLVDVVDDSLEATCGQSQSTDCQSVRSGVNEK